MSGILSQLGFCEETQTTPAISTAIASAGPPIIFTLTFASAHGLQPGDTITLTGFTPSGYNATWTIYQVPTTTTATVVTLTSLGNSTVQGTYVASIYGRGGTVDRFYDMVSEGMKLTSPRIESAGLRANNRVQKADKWAINRTGATGPIVLEVQTKQFGRILKHLMGNIATTGPTDSVFTHTATIGAMVGKSLLAQVGKPFTQSQVVSPFTYPGVKIIDWTFSCALDGILLLTLTLDAQDEQTSVVLAAASYPTNSELLTYAGGTISIGGVAVDVSDFTLKCTMGYKADRRFIRANTLQREPAEGPMRIFDWTVMAEFTDMLQYSRFASVNRVGALATFVASFVGPSLVGAASFASMTFISGTNAARVDSDSPVVAGPDLLPLPIAGKLLNTAGGTNDALTIAYVTADSTP
ncbi:MAG TPA: phage tail tube protein [Mycobacterium sp.]|jgi:hypothetical protein|uniref:phage tail tube protein n=1 Tax=Mycobacterium sp. TaxID=1785 RepID=UPI002F3EC492